MRFLDRNTVERMENLQAPLVGNVLTKLKGLERLENSGLEVKR